MRTKTDMPYAEDWFDELPYYSVGDEGEINYDIPKIVEEAMRRGEVKAWEEMDAIWDLEQSRRYPLHQVMLELRGKIVKKLAKLTELKK